MTNATKGKIIRAIATLICVGAPLGATISQFPVWITVSSKATVSGMFIVLAVLCCLPFYKQIREYIKSPSAWVVWLVLFAFFACLRNIIDQMFFVCGVGLLANCIGTLLYKLGDYIKGKPDKVVEETNGTDREQA